MTEWLFLAAAGAVGFAFISPMLQTFAVKILPNASASTQKVVTALLGGLGVIAAIYIAEQFFGGKVKNI
jgi:hypothetical protein